MRRAIHSGDFESGFTLLEALIALVILSIAVAIAVPSFTQLIAKKQVESSIIQIAQALNLARSEAVARNTPASACPRTGNSCGGDWSEGVLVFIDDNQNGAQDAGEVVVGNAEADFSRLTFTINNYGNSVTYLADGSVNINGSIRVCNDYGYGMQLSVNAVGRPRLVNASADCL